MRVRGLPTHVGNNRVELCVAAFILSVARVASAGPKATPHDAAACDSAPARVEPRTPPRIEQCREPAEPSALGRVAATAGALIPGVLVHGTGHWVAGRPRTARRLLAMEGIGLGGVAVGGTTIVLTGASRYLVGPSAAMVVGGMGLFGISLLADVYGAAMPESARGTARRTVPAVETSLGYAYVYDPEFRYRNFVRDSVNVRAGRWRVEGSAWFALDDPNARMRLLGAHRLYGPLVRGQWPVARDGSYLDVDVAVTHHRYWTERFQTLAGEVELRSRVDLARIDPALHGSFGEMGVGWGAAVFGYDVGGLGFGADWEDLLLASFGFGMYLGDRGSELTLYYDHRHDDYAAGLKITGLASGVAGHFGLSSRLYLDDRWGVGLGAEIGSAAIASLSVLFRSEKLE